MLTAKKRLWLFLAFLSAGILFSPAVLALFYRWEEPVSYFDHALFVPFVCLWMVYREKNHRRAEHFTRSRVAVALLIIGLLLELAGSAQQIVFVQGLSLVWVIWSSVLLFYGKSGFIRYRWPLFYSLLLIPIPSFFMAQMTIGLREMSTTAASATLHAVMSLFVQPFLRVGNELHFAGHQVTIVDACSGMNTLLTVIAVGFVLVYLEKSRLTAWITAALLVPVAILANLMRILTICFFVGIHQEGFAFGEGHVPIGVFTVGAAFAVLAFGIRAPQSLKMKWDKAPPSNEERPLQSENDFKHDKRRDPPVIIFSLLLIVAAALSVAAKNTAKPAPGLQPHEPMPKLTLPDWQATETPLDETTYDVVGTHDAHMLRFDPLKSSAFQKPIYVYWLRSESSRKVGHPPELCYRGENYDILERSEISVSAHGHSFPVIRLLVQRGNYKLLVYYWYRIGGVETASYLQHQLQWVWTHVKHLNFSAENSESSMTRLSTEVDSESEKRLQNWLEESLVTGE